ncbi:MAG: ribosome biogenesis GTPase Der [Gammaproteobacteria bacterium]|nr:ribosome biogenesis GTPase Der [Gammaproteobacteria bacterium]
MLPVIALVGRPNVGKSTLFNRLTKTRDALVASYPGLTRDRQYGRGRIGNFSYLVIDTGGITENFEAIDVPLASQVQKAIAEADLIFFLVDSQLGRISGDDNITRMLREGGRKIILIANKIDGQDPDFVSAEFSALGLGEPLKISAKNGNGVRSLLIDNVIPFFPGNEKNALENLGSPELKIAVVGRPNVGKSTLVNRLLGEDRVVVFDKAGTTRDSIYIPFERNARNYILIDTAGVRRRGKISETVEKFSILKTLEAINDSNVVIFMVDAKDGVVEQDLHLLGHVLEEGRGVVVAINKWDGMTRESKEMVRKQIDRRLRFVKFANIHFISALHGSDVGSLYASIDQAYRSATLRASTSLLNEILERAVFEHQPPLINGRRIKLRYAHLGGVNPPIVVIHGNQTRHVPEAYARYLKRRFIEDLDLRGTPMRLEFRTTDNPYKGKKNTLTSRQKIKRKRMMDHVRKSKRKIKGKT